MGVADKTRSRAPRPLVALVVAAVLSTSLGAWGQTVDDTPPTRIGLMLGMRQNLGEAGDSYDFGLLAGIDAGFKPKWLPVGFLWSVLFGLIDSSDPRNVDTDLSIVEMSLGLHGRVAISRPSQRYLFATTGLSFLRTENTLPPDGKRQFFGPYVGGGWEEYFLGNYLVGLEVRYGLLAGGPQSLSLNLTINFGTK